MNEQTKYGTHNGIYSTIKRNKIFIYATIQMGLENIMLSEIRQTQKDNPTYMKHVEAILALEIQFCTWVAM